MELFSGAVNTDCLCALSVFSASLWYESWEGHHRDTETTERAQRV